MCSNDFQFPSLAEQANHNDAQKLSEKNLDFTLNKGLWAKSQVQISEEELTCSALFMGNMVEYISNVTSVDLWLSLKLELSY